MTVNGRSASRLRRATPQVFVTDVERAMTFYRALLGFEVVFMYGDPPFYGEVRRGDASLNLRLVDRSPFVAGAREQEQLLSAYVTTTDVQDLYLEFEAAGVDVQEELQRKPWGAEEFVIRDPDENLLLFGAPSAEPSWAGRSGVSSPPGP